MAEDAEVNSGSSRPEPRPLGIKRILSMIPLLTLFGAVVAWAFTTYFSWRTANDGRETVRSERFSKAVELLASDNVAGRVGSIRSLQMIVRDDAKYREDVLEILREFLATRSGYVSDPYRKPRSCKTATRVIDVAGALNAMGEITEPGSDPYPTGPIDLSCKILDRVDMSDLDLSGVSMERAQAMHADMSRSLLKGTSFANCNLDFSKFNKVKWSAETPPRYDLDSRYFANMKIRFTDFSNATLDSLPLDPYAVGQGGIAPVQAEGARFDGASLIEAQISNLAMTSNYSNAPTAISFHNANLTSARLPGRRSASVSLDGATITDAKWGDGSPVVR